MAQTHKRTGNIFTERTEGGRERGCEMEKKINGCKLAIGVAAIDPELERRKHAWCLVSVMVL